MMGHTLVSQNSRDVAHISIDSQAWLMAIAESIHSISDITSPTNQSPALQLSGHCRVPDNELAYQHAMSTSTDKEGVLL